MKYLLADMLVYDNEDGTLTLQNDAAAESQSLTCTAQTILNLLIDHHGMVVERETFLQEVWDNRGLHGSSNSLNQYISILRKMLATLVPDSLFIVTVPKVGFMLSADMPVIPLDTETRESAPASPRSPRITGSLILVTLIVTGLCLAALFWNAHRQRAELFLLSHIDTCPVYSFTPFPDAFREQADALLAQIQKAGEFRCLPDSLFYVHIQDPLLYGDQGRLVLSQCSRFRGHTSSCQTLYYYEW